MEPQMPAADETSPAPEAIRQPLDDKPSTVWKVPGRDWFSIVLLLLIVGLAWCWHYNRWTPATWATPVNYVGDRSWDMTFTGDALWGMAGTKAMADGEIRPILPKYPRSLGAPFRANWNDFPSVEEGVNAWWAGLAWLCGVFVGSNVALLVAHLLAAITFYAVCRYLKYGRAIAIVMAALFALSRYAFWRNLPNLSLTYYWHLPLGLLVLWWCIRPAPKATDARRWIVSIAVAVLFGVQSPYFSGMFGQLLVWAALFCLVRYRDLRATILPAALAVVLFITLAVMNLDTLYSRFVDGPNARAAERSYAGIERYALRPVEFLLPRSHSLQAFERWAHRVYFDSTMIPGEEGSAYLGIIGCLALAALAWTTTRAAATADLPSIPCHFWGVGLVLGFSIMGGFNGVAGLFGIWLLRATDRYSIVILTILLLFLARQLTLLTRNWSRTGLATLCFFLLAIGMYDQIPPRYPELETAAQKSIQSEKKLVSQIESRLPPNAMVFQLPVYEFPEGAQIYAMRDYEHFRPYLHAHSLRFSYGAIRGRGTEIWQKEAEMAGPYELVKRLERYGFSAVLINKSGYPDNAIALVEAMRSLGKTRVLASSDDWICIRLNPVRHPVLPPSFDSRWHPLEPSNWRWSSGDASLVLQHPGPDVRTVDLDFRLAVFNRRYIVISVGDRTLFDGVIDSGSPQTMDLKMTLKPGRNEIVFKTDRPGEFLSSGDSRKLAFSVIDFKVR
jgi:phosphoglycerol transferase